MDTSSIIHEILYYTHLNRAQLAAKIGVNPQRIQSYKEGRVKQLPVDFVDLLCDKWPEFNRAYLLSGVGRLVERNDGINVQNNSNNNNSTINANTEHIKETIDILSKQLDEKDKQIETLHKIILNLSEKQ